MFDIINDEELLLILLLEDSLQNQNIDENNQSYNWISN